MHSPPIARIQPLYRPLGYLPAPTTGHPKGRRERYAVEINGRVEIVDARDLHGLPFLLRVYPDPEHWRRLFPRGGQWRRHIDTLAAAAWFIRECKKVGEFDPKNSP